MELSPLVDIEIDPKNPMIAYEKLKRALLDMIEKGQKALEIKAENQKLKKELEEWRMMARLLMPELKKLQAALRDVKWY